MAHRNAPQVGPFQDPTQQLIPQRGKRLASRLATAQTNTTSSPVGNHGQTRSPQAVVPGGPDVGATPFTNQVASVLPHAPVLPVTSSRSVSWRAPADNPVTSVAPSPPLPNRATWAPIRKDQGKSALELQKMKSLALTQLGHDFRLNENLTAAVPQAILPGSFGLGPADPAPVSINLPFTQQPFLFGIGVQNAGAPRDPSSAPMMGPRDDPGAPGSIQAGQIHPAVVGFAALAALAVLL